MTATIFVLACILSALVGGGIVWVCMVADFVVRVDDLQRESHE